MKAKKHFGQNFLMSELHLQSIVSHVRSQSGYVLEIGCGTGMLTRHLLGAGFTVVSVDIDPEAIAAVAAHPRLTLVHADILQLQPTQIMPSDSYAVVGNLPFHIGTKIITNILGDFCSSGWAWAGTEMMVLMFQNEVARRLTADVNCSDYNGLSIYMHAKSHSEYLFSVGAGCFRPRPKVDAGVISMHPKYNQLLQDISPDMRQIVHRLIRGAFSHRRKNLKNALSGLLCEAQICQAGCMPTARPQNLALEDFVRMAQVLSLG